MAAPFPGYLNCSSLGLSSWVFGLGRGTAVPLEILGRGTSGCGPRALRRSRAGGGGPFRMPAGTEAASPPASAPAASASPGADWPETQSPGPLLSHEQLRRLHFDAERRLIEQALAHRFIRVGPQRGATRPEMIRSSEITGGFELRATCRARAPFDRNRVIGAPRHHSSERGKIRLSSPYRSLETYATEY